MVPDRSQFLPFGPWSHLNKIKWPLVPGPRYPKSNTRSTARTREFIIGTPSITFYHQSIRSFSCASEFLRTQASTDSTCWNGQNAMLERKCAYNLLSLTQLFYFLPKAKEVYERNYFSQLVRQGVHPQIQRNLSQYSLIVCGRDILSKFQKKSEIFLSVTFAILKTDT